MSIITAMRLIPGYPPDGNSHPLVSSTGGANPERSMEKEPPSPNAHIASEPQPAAATATKKKDKRIHKNGAYVGVIAGPDLSTINHLNQKVSGIVQE